MSVLRLLAALHDHVRHYVDADDERRNDLVTTLRLWLARRMAPGGWHVQRDPVRRKVNPAFLAAAAKSPAVAAELAYQVATGETVEFPGRFRANPVAHGVVSDPSMGNGAP